MDVQWGIIAKKATSIGIMQSITVEQLAALRPEWDKLVLLDVRDPWEFEICRLPGAVNIPMNEIAQRQQELDPEARTVAICHFGMRSLEVGTYLAASGFSDIANLEGGLDAWAERVDGEMPRY